MATPPRLAHCVFRTNQLPQMVDWYCKLLGARINHGTEKIAFLTNDAEHHRIALVAKNLRAMGAEVEEFEDGLDVPGGQTLHGATIDSGGDHRIAMAFSVAALRAEGDTLIQGAESAAISFPEFFDLLDLIAER